MPSPDRPLRILVSNDDGIDSPGIRALADALRSIGHVDVVAPTTQQSAVGHALTVALPLRATEFERNGESFGWAVSGTPADSVKLAVKQLLPEIPDIVISGINHGRNAAVSLIYSGTVSAATEGTLLGIPSIAISLDNFSNDADFTYAAKVAAWIVLIIAARGLPRGVLINVNVPALPESEILGIRIAPQGESYWDDHYEVRNDPMGRPYYWLKGHNVLLGPNGSDDKLITEGYVTITPVHYKLTDEPTLEAMRGWDLESDGGGLRSTAGSMPAGPEPE
ncbi:MAG: 5'/3'-nucleotidase SurE [Candidatus Kapaibacterium sp.]